MCALGEQPMMRYLLEHQLRPGGRRVRDEMNVGYLEGGLYNWMAI